MWGWLHSTPVTGHRSLESQKHDSDFKIVPHLHAKSSRLKTFKFQQPLHDRPQRILLLHLKLPELLPFFQPLQLLLVAPVPVQITTLIWINLMTLA